MSEESDTMAEYMEGLERRVNIRDCTVIIGVLVGACNDRSTCGASSMRITFCEGGTEVWEDVFDEREVMASSITVRVCEMLVDLSLKILEGVDGAACAGTSLDMGADSVGIGPLIEPGGFLGGIGLRPGIVVLDRCASRMGDRC